jgi:Protein of unknown function (DUF3102)
VSQLYVPHPNVSALVKRTIEKIRHHQHRTVAEIIDIGTDLIRVKDALNHGQFSKWLKAVGWSERTARNYMGAAKVFEGKTATVADLPPATIYRLAAPSTPAEVRDEIVARLESSEKVSITKINDVIDDARARERKRRAEAKLTNRQRRARARSAAQRKREREEWEAKKRVTLERAETVARELIAEYGAATIRTILDAAEDWDVREALREAVREPL